MGRSSLKFFTARPVMTYMLTFGVCLLMGMFLFIPSTVLAQSLTLDMGQGGGAFTGRIVQLLGLMTVLSLAPSIVMMVTSFTRMVVVFSILRTALGLQQSPPNPVLVSLAMFMTFFVMAPTFEKAYEEGIQPYTQEKLTEEEAFAKTGAPFKVFMLKHVRPADLSLFMDLTKTPTLEKDVDTPFSALVPAFMISELRRAFEIGFLIFIPFLIIDLVVSSILMGMGMMMLPPASISLPFKLIFFVLVDGWHLIVGSLVKGFGTG